MGFLAALAAALASASALVVRLRPDVRVPAALLSPFSAEALGTSTLMWSTILTPFCRNAPRPCCVVLPAADALGGIAMEEVSARVREGDEHAPRKARRDARTVIRDPTHAMRRGD